MDSYYLRSQHHHHEHHRRKLHLWIIIILIILVYCGYCLFRPLDALTVSAVDNPVKTSATSKPVLPWPAGAESAIGTDIGGVLATSSENQQTLPTASIAKLITALTILNKFPLTPIQQGPTITLGPNDVALYNKYYAEDGSLVQVKAGEQITEHQALEAMLLPSANNMADSLAIWAFDSLPQYRVAAQNEVVTLGLKHTSIGTDASGFLPGTTSTPSDLIKLGQAVLASPILKQIVSEKTAVVPVAGEIHNVNYLLGTSGIIGIKTGNSTQAGGCLLFAANDQISQNNEVTIIGAIQHAPDMLAAMQAATPLLSAAEHNLKLTNILQTGQTVANYTAPWLPQPVPIVAQQNLSLPLWPNEQPQQSISVASYKPPRLIDSPFHTIAAGTIAGKVNIDGSYTLPLVVSRQISPPSIFWRLTHPV